MEAVRSVGLAAAPGPGPGPASADRWTSVRLAGRDLSCGLIHWRLPEFLPDEPPNRRRALVRKLGFACNFRDRGLALQVASGAPPGSCYIVGSDFVGEVVAVGAEVRGLSPGDRVIADSGRLDSTRSPSVATNHASLELEALAAERLIPIPTDLPVESAACFAISAQTAYAMARRLELTGRERVLVTAASSNTSLFAIQALARYGVEMSATTTRPRSMHERLHRLGVGRVFPLPAGRFADDPEIGAAARAMGGFDAVVDPYYDLHLERALGVLRDGGRYVTCGLRFQTPHLEPPPASSADRSNLLEVLRALLLKSLVLIGNCSGTREDLRRAVDDACAGRLSAVVDRVFSPQEVGPWFERTFTHPERFGKTPLLYGPSLRE